MVAFKSFRWTTIGFVCGGLATAVGLGFFYASPENIWSLRATEFTSKLGFWAMRDWYPAHYVDRTPWASNLGLVLGGALQWGAVGLVYDLGRLLVTRRTRMSAIEPNR
jgi:hypothetical protein